MIGKYSMKLPCARMHGMPAGAETVLGLAALAHHHQRQHQGDEPVEAGMKVTIAGMWMTVPCLDALL